MAAAINHILASFLETDDVVLWFSNFTTTRPEQVEAKKQKWTNMLKDVFGRLNQEQTEAGLKNFLAIAAQASDSQVNTLLDLLSRLIKCNGLSARTICEQVINSEQLDFKHTDFWMKCFKFIIDNIEYVEYKGVREIMKGCCEKAKGIPNAVSVGQNQQMLILIKLVRKMMNRDNCLIPGYLLVNELQKGYSEFPHWRLSGAFMEYIDSFRPCAQMVSIIGHGDMRPVVEHSGCPEHLVTPWKLDSVSLRYSIKGTLPYAPEVLQKQTGLLRYVLEQPYSRDMVCGMLGLQKQQKHHCAVLEEQLIELVLVALEKSEEETDENVTHGLWLHLSSQLIYFVLFQFANFQNIVVALCDRLQGKTVTKGRDQLMWVLLQFISGAIQRNPLTNFLSVLRLHDLLFPEHEPKDEVDITQPQCTRQMAMTCIWIHLTKKAQLEGHAIQSIPVPKKLRAHYDFLQHLAPSAPLQMGQDYRIILLCNAYSTNQDHFSKPMAALVESIQGSKSLPAPTIPLSMSVLDSLTVHSKMSLIHSIVTHVIKLAQTKAGLPLAPALVETYSRLLVYTEIESLGIKGFINQLLPAVYKSHAWATLYTLLEMFSYRIHHIHPHYRVQLLSSLHSLAAGPQANHTQLHLCVESTALRLITGLGSAEVQPELSRSLQISEAKTLVSAESEELNRALVLTLARATHVTGADGSWCIELLTSIAQSTPHAWAPHTLEGFPEAMAKFFQQHPVPKENKQQLKKAVEEEYRKWASMNNENDILAHFGVPSAPPLFLCLVWKMLLELDSISLIAYKIVERIGARALSAHLRKFCDCLVFEFTNSPGGQHVNRCVDTINEMIWKHNIVTIDRVVLCLALRTQEGSEAQVCSFIIQLLLLKASEFRNRVQEFVKENNPDHWNQNNWHEKHLEFHRMFPEKFANEESSSYHPYFGNVCLRFLPVFDIVIHRFLEIPQVAKSLEILLEHLGCLYKFHDRPVTYLYNTLHYYERKLSDRPPLKKKLVAAILGSSQDILSDEYQQYLARVTDESWEPTLYYYIGLVKRVVETLQGIYKGPIAGIDWRFNEFPNAGAHILYTTCVELMAVPLPADKVADRLLDVITIGWPVIPTNDLIHHINAVGLILTALPPSYMSQLLKRLVKTFEHMNPWTWKTLRPLHLFNFPRMHYGLLESRYSHILACAHSVWHHAAPGQLATIPVWVKEVLPGIIKNEYQLLYLSHLIGPFLSRFNMGVVELVTSFYELLAQVDQNQDEWKYMDPICDFLYHIKYMFVGDSLKRELEVIVKKLKPKLQRRLRFIVNVDEANASASTTQTAAPTEPVSSTSAQ